jgi:glycosyltransferase involved in cell wall biosynthesis
LIRALFRTVFGRADHAIVLSESFVPPLQRWGVPSALISVSKTMFDGRLVQMPVVRTGQIPRIVFLSRVSPLKGVGELLQAAAALHRQGYEFTLDIHGHGATDTIIGELEAMAQSEGLDGICRFPGFIDGAAKYAALANADIFVLPSYQEGCPNAVTEALASGAFVVSTRVGAIPELITQDYQGFLIEPRDSLALAEALRSTLENIEAIRADALRRRAAALESFEADIIIRQVQQIYGALLESPPPANQ